MAGDTDRLYALLKEGKCEELMLRHVLTEELYEELKLKTTAFGGNLGDCIRTGCENANTPGIGLRACDPNAYSTFAPLIDRLVKEYHKVHEIQHPSADFGDLDNLGLDLKSIDPDGTYIKSTRVRVARSIEGFGFHPIMNSQDRLDLERKVFNTLEQLEGEFKGEYLPISEMSRETQDLLVKNHYLFNDFNRVLKSAGGYRDWPTGRGIFFNRNKTFLVWLQEEDHVRIISMHPGADLQAVYRRLALGIRRLEQLGLKWARDNRLGYIAFCPTNLGTGLRASVHLDVPLLSKTDHFKDFCAKRNLQIRGADGDATEAYGTVFDISNKRRLGLTEIEAVRDLFEGVKDIIEEEKLLSKQ